MTATDLDSLPSAGALHVHDVVHLPLVTSTMDEAHARATLGASAGTLIVADRQSAGRGRGGNVWESEAGQGVWCTLIERPTDAAAVDVLSIRLGLAIAKSIEAFAESSISLKWPNDLYVGARKLAGILVEARWREGTLDWVAIGIGINLTVPHNTGGAGALRAGTTRNDVLLQMIPAVRTAIGYHGILSHHEQEEWMTRDLAVNRRVTAPVAGIVRGLERNGALRVEDEAGVVHELRSGSLLFTTS